MTASPLTDFLGLFFFWCWSAISYEPVDLVATVFRSLGKQQIVTHVVATVVHYLVPTAVYRPSVAEVHRTLGVDVERSGHPLCENFLNCDSTLDNGLTRERSMGVVRVQHGQRACIACGPAFLVGRHQTDHPVIFLVVHVLGNHTHVRLGRLLRVVIRGHDLDLPVAVYANEKCHIVTGRDSRIGALDLRRHAPVAASNGVVTGKVEGFTVYGDRVADRGRCQPGLDLLTAQLNTAIGEHGHGIFGVHRGHHICVTEIEVLHVAFAQGSQRRIVRRYLSCGINCRGVIGRGFVLRFAGSCERGGEKQYQQITYLHRMSLQIGTVRAGATNVRKLIDFRQISRGRDDRALAVSKPRGEHRFVRILHFSDIHLGLGLKHIPLSDWPSKRLAGGANLLRGRGKRFSAAADKTRAMVRLAGELGADLVLCTGDLTALATDAEYEAARSILEPLLVTGRFVVIPGNHDLYTRRDVKERRFTRRFASGLKSDVPDLCTDGPWPIVRLPSDDVAVLAVNSARPILLKSSGRVPDAQLEGLRAALADPRIAGRFVFLMTHYAPCRADGSPDTWEHGLDNVDDLLDAAAGIERGVYLCGHIHTTFRQRIAGFAGEVFCAGSSTLAGREGFWLFDSGAAGWEARLGRWSGDVYVVDPPDTGNLVSG